MLDTVYTLNKMGLKPGMSVNRAINKVGLDISESRDPLSTANRIIVSLGGQPVGKTIRADVIAKALIEQAVLCGSNYKAENALVIAEAKFSKIEATMPYVFAGSDDSRVVNTKVEVKEKRGGDKKERALEIYNREKGKNGTEIAKMIAEEIDITFANAYYYVSRVFGKYK